MCTSVRTYGDTITLHESVSIRNENVPKYLRWKAKGGSLTKLANDFVRNLKEETAEQFDRKVSIEDGMPPETSIKRSFEEVWTDLEKVLRGWCETEGISKGAAFTRLFNIQKGRVWARWLGQFDDMSEGQVTKLISERWLVSEDNLREW